MLGTRIQHVPRPARVLGTWSSARRCESRGIQVWIRQPHLVGKDVIRDHDTHRHAPNGKSLVLATAGSRAHALLIEPVHLLDILVHRTSILFNLEQLLIFSRARQVVVSPELTPLRIPLANRLAGEGVRVPVDAEPDARHSIGKDGFFEGGEFDGDAGTDVA